MNRFVIVKNKMLCTVLNVMHNFLIYNINSWNSTLERKLVSSQKNWQIFKLEIFNKENKQKWEKSFKNYQGIPQENYDHYISFIILFLTILRSITSVSLSLLELKLHFPVSAWHYQPLIGPMSKNNKVERSTVSFDRK